MARIKGTLKGTLKGTRRSLLIPYKGNLSFPFNPIRAWYRRGLTKYKKYISWMVYFLFDVNLAIQVIKENLGSLINS